MTPYAFTLLLFAPLAGAGLLTLYMPPSSILYDRFLVAGLGALLGLVLMIFVLGNWHFASRFFGLAGG